MNTMSTVTSLVLFCIAKVFFGYAQGEKYYLLKNGWVSVSTPVTCIRASEQAITAYLFYNYLF